MLCPDRAGRNRCFAFSRPSAAGRARTSPPAANLRVAEIARGALLLRHPPVGEGIYNAAVAKVRVLPQVLAHQIAAGEIVERPASVVKELVENSIDAEATSVRIQVEDGGKRLIRVRDDGFGMSAEDAQLAFEHHATSKIAELEDLRAVTTLGFRGEALPSIASVSRVRLRTAERAPSGVPPAPGTEIEYEGGRRIRVDEIAWPGGTEIAVRDLFFNVAARRKFLKTASTELSHVSRLVLCAALAHPAIEFHLEHQSRSLIEATRVDTLRERAFQLLGERLLEVMVSLSYEAEGVRIGGLASLPHEQRNSSNSLYLFVNRRPVRDRLLTHAVRQAYRDLIPTHAYPVVVLFVETDPDAIDVNVHPAKAEIRFRHSQDVHRAIVRAVEQALLLHPANVGRSERDGPAGSVIGARSAVDAFLRRTSAGTFFQQNRPQASIEAGTEGLDPGTPFLAGRRPSSPTSRFPHGTETPRTEHLSAAPVVLGQFVESFIVAVDREGVMIVDQHAAHERILYDRAAAHLAAAGPAPVQKLLLTKTMELDPRQLSVAAEVLDYLNDNGFEVEWFGDRTLLVRGVPAAAAQVDPADILEQLFNELDDLDEVAPEGSEPDRGLRRIREKIAISISCRGAVKINTPLGRERMQWLIDELFGTENPYTCPHGRPIVVRLALEDVLRGFHRI
jgi:DNA mismatch repair protein MutL